MDTDITIHEGLIKQWKIFEAHEVRFLHHFKDGVSPEEVLELDLDNYHKARILLQQPLFTDEELRLIACHFAEKGLRERHENPDQRLIDGLEVTRDFINGHICILL